MSVQALCKISAQFLPIRLTIDTPSSIAREAGCKVYGKDGGPMDAEAISAQHYFVIRPSTHFPASTLSISFTDPSLSTGDVGDGPEGRQGEEAQDHLCRVFFETVQQYEV